MAHLRLPEPQRRFLRSALDHPSGLTPPKTLTHPATWHAVLDRLFIDGPDGAQRITPSGEHALTTGHSIELIPVWQFRWACVTSDLCVDRRTRRAVALREGSWWLLPDHGEARSAQLLATGRDHALRRAAEILTRRAGRAAVLV